MGELAWSLHASTGLVGSTAFKYGQNIFKRESCMPAHQAPIKVS
eukprot:CAMPEP_0170593704 /NCGR_PEP_ID=MMETSP0224-20130122/13599_1 /TAXON_ID=285029 /ORGANISM="Togula jolla, Strain CCCM 725" /LENGTH=43 /DNA_ID= /DNA_START= /DNA_END= /DNA_ORIENTATION=